MGSQFATEGDFGVANSVVVAVCGRVRLSTGLIYLKQRQTFDLKIFILQNFTIEFQIIF